MGGNETHWTEFLEKTTFDYTMGVMIEVSEDN